MEFLNRQNEMKRLSSLAKSPSGGLAIIWGRRRLGKTRLLTEWCSRHKGVYFVGDESTPVLQRKYLSLALAEAIPGFDQLIYPDWRSLFTQLGREVRSRGWKGPLIIDELPYLVQSSPELPSILQGFVDQEVHQLGLSFVLCGSSQRMMQGAALSPTAPLYGRADEILKLHPLSVSYISEGLGIEDPKSCIEAFAIWGGVPRYWELAARHGGNLYSAVSDLVLDPMGPLHEEPNRLLLEESPSAISLRPILDAIGLGAHRLSEIAARTGSRITSLPKQMQQLIELDLIYREIPFGASEKNSKKTLYKIADPFLRFWFTAVASKRSQLLRATQKERERYLKKKLPPLFSITWEELCRKTLPALAQKWKMSCLETGRYWHGQEHEWDLVARLEDEQEGGHVFVGECKWVAKRPSAEWAKKEIEQLIRKGMPPIQKSQGGNVSYLLFVPEKPKGFRSAGNVRMIDAKEVVQRTLLY